MDDLDELNLAVSGFVVKGGTTADRRIKINEQETKEFKALLAKEGKFETMESFLRTMAQISKKYDAMRKSA